MPLYIEKKWTSGQVLPMPHRQTDRYTLKDRAAQLLIKYKSGALVTQLKLACWLQFFDPIRL